MGAAAIGAVAPGAPSMTRHRGAPDGLLDVPRGATTVVTVEARPGRLGARRLAAVPDALEHEVHDVGGQVLGGGWRRRWPRRWPVPPAPRALGPAVVHPVQLVAHVGQAEGGRTRRWLPRHHGAGEAVVAPAGVTSSSFVLLAAVTRRPRGAQQLRGQRQLGDVQLVQRQLRVPRG